MMVDLKDFIDDADLERKMETFMINGKGRIDDACKDCGGLRTLQNRGQYARNEGEVKQTPEIMDSLRLQLLDKMEDFRQRKGEECKLEKLV